MDQVVFGIVIVATIIGVPSILLVVRMRKDDRDYKKANEAAKTEYFELHPQVRERLNALLRDTAKDERFGRPTVDLLYDDWPEFLGPNQESPPLTNWSVWLEALKGFDQKLSGISNSIALVREPAAS